MLLALMEEKTVQAWHAVVAAMGSSHTETKPPFPMCLQFQYPSNTFKHAVGHCLRALLVNDLFGLYFGNLGYAFSEELQWDEECESNNYSMGRAAIQTDHWALHPSSNTENNHFRVR